MYRYLFRLSKPSNTRGIRVGVFLPDETDRSAIVRKIELALGTIERHCPARFQDLRRYFAGIFVTKLTGVGQYDRGSRICLLDFDYTLRASTTATKLGGTILHELAHARLRQHGFPHNQANRPRVERICLNAELTLARRTGDEEFVSEVEDMIDQPDHFWSVEADRDRERKKVKELGRGWQLVYQAGIFAVGVFRRRAI